MDFQASQRTRYLLQTRVRRLKTATYGQYIERLNFFLDFIESNTLFQNILAEIKIKSSLEKQVLYSILDARQLHQFNSEIEYVAGSYYCLKYLQEKSKVQDVAHVIQRVFHLITGDQKGLNECFEGVNDSCVEFLADHLDEQLDASQTIMLLLYKYKHSLEWFKRQEARAIAEGNHPYFGLKEKGLASHLYSYLYEQGIDFHIEPSSASGEVDLIASQTDDDRIILDVKYISGSVKPSEIKSKIISGFGQVYHYCCDFNSSCGYLVIFKNQGNVINIESEKQDSFSYISVAGKVIFFIVIDIFEYEKTASKRGSPDVIEIPKTELIKSIEGNPV